MVLIEGESMANTILHEPKQTWRQMADEHVALELAEARERITSLEADVTTYRQLACCALENIAQLTKRNKQLACRIDDLNQSLRELFNAPCLACLRRNRSERAA